MKHCLVNTCDKRLDEVSEQRGTTYLSSLVGTTALNIFASSFTVGFDTIIALARWGFPRRSAAISLIIKENRNQYNSGEGENPHYERETICES